MRKHFYIFRHGETDLNKQKRWQGSGSDFDLNEVGVEQAAMLAEKLKGEGLQIIFSSPLIRARHTADVIASSLGIEVSIRDNLKECHYGQAEGRLIAELDKEVPEILNNWYNPDLKYLDNRFPGGESKREARDRVLAELNVLTNESFEIAGIAIHGGTMGQLLNYFEVPYDKIPNCAVFKLSFKNGLWQVDRGLF